MFVDNDIKLLDEYCDYSGKKVITNHSINKKYYVYNVKTGQKVKYESNNTENNEILNTIEYKKNKFLIFYIDKRQNVSFVLTRMNKKFSFEDIIAKIELFPSERLFIKSFINNIYIFGVLRINDVDYSKVRLSLGKNNNLEENISYIFPKSIRDKFHKSTFILFLIFHLCFIKINKKDLLEKYLDDSEINLSLVLDIKHKSGIHFKTSLKKNQKDKFDKKHYLYNTFSYKLNNNIYCFIRKTVSGNLVLVFTTRLSKTIVVKEFLAYGRYLLMPKKKANIYFEKFSEGASESAYEVFKYAIRQNDENAYYLIDENASNYADLKKEYGNRILQKNSTRAFHKIFSASKLISSEIPTHIQRRLYDNDYLIKKKILNCHEKIFLQHGVALATNIFERGYFNPRIPIIPDYVVVNSELEKEYFQRYTNYSDERLWLTGVPNLDLYIKEKDKPKNEISFILTWRPWDLSGTVTDKSYVSRYLEFISLIEKEEFYKDKKINLILHPKAKNILKNQFPDIYETIRSKIYSGNIKDALIKSKVVISDYSSIVFYAFGSGSNIVFYWEDKETAEEHYNSKNVLQEETAFGDIIYNFDEIHTSIVKNYKAKQSKSYIDKYHISVEKDNGNNTKDAYQMISN